MVDDYSQIESKISPENKAVSISYNNRLQGDKRVEISWLNGEKRLRHAGRYLKLATENQAVIESSTGSSVTVWEQRSEKAKKRLYAVVEQMKNCSRTFVPSNSVLFASCNSLSFRLENLWCFRKTWRFAITNVEDKPAHFKARVVDR